MTACERVIRPIYVAQITPFRQDLGLLIDHPTGSEHGHRDENQKPPELPSVTFDTLATFLDQIARTRFRDPSHARSRPQPC